MEEGLGVPQADCPVRGAAQLLVQGLDPLGGVKENIKTVHGSPATLLRGEVLSLSDLGNVLGTEMDDEERDEYPVVVVKIGKNKIGFIVNELISQQEIVIKSLITSLSFSQTNFPLG